jgi:precorrin-2 methylase
MTITISITCPDKTKGSDLSRALTEIAETVSANVSKGEKGGFIVHGSGAKCQWMATAERQN